jgi:hypothetical protein
MPETPLPSIFKKITADFSALEISFTRSDVFYWSPQERTIFFIESQIEKGVGIYQLLHEIGHAICEHHSFRSGISLLKMEVEAWEKARQIATKYNIAIPEEHVESCLDSYRDWLHQRSACPECGNIATEIDDNRYRCFNCSQIWSTPRHQQTRCYRYRLKQIANSE